MKLNTEPIKNWFGFSRRERRSSFTLLLIILLILGVRYTVPSRTITIEDITGTFSESDLNFKDSIVSGSYLVDYNQRDRSYSKEPSATAKKVGPVRVRRTDGAGRYIEPQVASRKSEVGSREPIDINSSDSATLVKLPLIGPVLSARIIRYRNYLGGYARIEQLKEVYGLPEKTFEAIKGRVVADTLFIRKTNINTAEYKEISRIPYLEKYEVSSILKYREISGRINNLQELTSNKILSPEKAAKMGAYMKYD